MNTPPTLHMPARLRVGGVARLRSYLSWLVIACTVVTADSISQAADARIASLPRVQAGVAVANPDAPRWNRVLYQAVSRITQGDASSVPATIRSRVPLFTLVLLATATNTSVAGAPPVYRLAEVGAGYAVPLGGQLTVVSTDNPPSAAGIDSLGRQVLAGNGRKLDEARRVGASDTMQVVDIDTLFLMGRRHAPLVMRHFIWVDPGSGRCSCCVWLLEKRQAGGLAPTGHPPRWLEAGTRDDRAIHVDSGKFFLGMPTKDAFALTSLPPGIDLAWSVELRQAAALPGYGLRDLQRLSLAIADALEPLRRPAGQAAVSTR